MGDALLMAAHLSIFGAAMRDRFDPEPLFAGCPEAPVALGRARELLERAEAHDPERLARCIAERPEALGAVLRGVAAVAPCVMRFVAARPGVLLDLIEDDLTAPRSLESYQARVAADLAATADPAEAGGALRRTKYDELARISVREATPSWVPEARIGETLAELSHLAEAILDGALALAARQLEDEIGPPVWQAVAADGETREVALAFTVLGLGKLGGEELNYSSDVDLVYVHETPPPGVPLRGGPRDLSPQEYFTRLARRFGAVVEDSSGDGFLYRIDLDLRPEGGQGAMVVSHAQLADYYDGWAASWEKSAFMKARPIAGDPRFGWLVVRSIGPMIYQSSIDFGGVESIRNMKARVEEAHQGADDDVKLGRGGIRDVEFVAQALQLVHGGRAPQVRGRSAQGALEALGEIGALPESDVDELLGAYRFLRRVENRLQMVAERQTHRLPEPGPQREQLAWSLGFEGDDAVARFDAKLTEHRIRVRTHFDALFPDTPTDRILELFSRNARGLLGHPQSRTMLEQLAERFAGAVEQSADPERALANLDRFVTGLGERASYYGLLLDRPELVPRLTHMFGASRFLSAAFAARPELIAPVFEDPEHLLSTRDELRATHAEILGRLGERGYDDEEAGLAALRLFQVRELVNVGLLDLDERIDAEQAESALTEIAEVCLEEALGLAHRTVRRRASAAPVLERGAFLVVGLGKLGSRELSYGSDLDVMFLWEAEGEGAARAEAQDAYVRVAQKLGWALQTPTAEGICYEVDARLRPSGNQGVLVTSFAAFERYHEQSAALWERQALLRARPVAGSDALARAFTRARDEILRRPLPEDPRAEIHRIRQRMEVELAQEAESRRDLKTGRGGLLDVETVVQCLQLEHGASHPSLLEPRRIEALLDDLERSELLGAADAATLREGWAFLKRLSSRLRIVENRSINDLVLDRADLDSVARAMGYAASARSGTARLPLLEAYRRHTEAIRQVYDRMLA